MRTGSRISQAHNAALKSGGCCRRLRRETITRSVRVRFPNCSSCRPLIARNWQSHCGRASRTVTVGRRSSSPMSSEPTWIVDGPNTFRIQAQRYLGGSPVQVVPLTCREPSSSAHRPRTNWFTHVTGTSPAAQASVERSPTRSKRWLNEPRPVLSSFQPCTAKFGAPSCRDFRTPSTSASATTPSSC